MASPKFRFRKIAVNGPNAIATYKVTTGASAVFADGDDNPIATVQVESPDGRSIVLLSIVNDEWTEVLRLDLTTLYNP